MDSFRSNLYHALAEVLADPPGWMVRPGARWPLYAAAAGLAAASGAARRAAEAMQQIGAEAMPVRRARWQALLERVDPTQLCLYEAGALAGRLLDQATRDVESCYLQAGLEPVGAEMPDHVSLELAFLAHLAAAEADPNGPAQRAFIQNHAGRWLPALGRAIAAAGDPVYAPVGQLLVDWLEEVDHAPGQAMERMRPRVFRRRPVISRPQTCSLCSFCAHTCREGALLIQEDEHMTRLLFSLARCTGCGKCARICTPGALQMSEPTAGEAGLAGWRLLCESPRAACRSCGAPLISQAELVYVAGQLGDPAWLAYCQACRPGAFGEAQ